MSYELGSQVALGLELCADMDTRHRQEGRQAWAIGDTSKLYSAMHWIGYNEASVGAQVKLWTGDPAAARWQAEGAPSCGATWEDADIVSWHPGPCPVCGQPVSGECVWNPDIGQVSHPHCVGVEIPKPEPIVWCSCDKVGPFGSICPTCGGEMFPF